MRLLCFLRIVRQTPATVRMFVLFQAFTTLHALCNPILYACTYGQFRYQYCKQVNFIKVLFLSLVRCDTFKLKQLCNPTCEKTPQLIPREFRTRPPSISTNGHIDYGSTGNCLSDSFMQSTRTWSSTKS